MKLRRPTNKICILGYYGFRNLGDDLMLSGLIQRLHNIPSINQITVHVRENYYNFRLPKVRVTPTGTGVLSKLTFRLRRFLDIMSTSVVLWGGGTCLYEPQAGDFRSLRDLANKVTLYSILGKPFVFIGVGIGNIFSQGALVNLKKVLDHATLFYFRDPVSLERAKQIHGNGPWEKSGDLVFLVDSVDHSQRGKPTALKNVAFCGTAYQASDASLCFRYGSLLAQIVQEYGVHIHFIPFHGGIRNDNLFHALVASHLPTNSFTIHEFKTPIEALSILKQMDFVIGFRLHAVVFADIMHIPNLAVEYSPKVRYYIEKSGILPKKRIFALGQNFGPETIIGLAEQYRRLKDEVSRFVRQERLGCEIALQDLKKRFLSA